MEIRGVKTLFKKCRKTFEIFYRLKKKKKKKLYNNSIFWINSAKFWGEILLKFCKILERNYIKILQNSEKKFH